jgi:heme/copper-type cytochrome/quinol oxidase subunit 4
MAALLAESTTRITYELARLQSFSERWQYLILGVVCLAIVALAVWMVRRDSIELRPWVAGLLMLLRVGALAGLLLFYLHLEKRSERRVVHNSRVHVLVDTSLSMGLHDATASSVPASPNRVEQVVSVLDQGHLVDKLRATHDVVVSRFDGDVARVSTYPKVEKPAADQPGAANPPSEATAAAKIPDTADLQAALLPQGTETRLGQSLRQVINDERSTPVAGVIVFSDGGQNAGIDPSAAIATARDAKIPIFTVGIGANRRPANVRVSDLVAPARAYPGDSFKITGYLQAEGLADRTVTVELSSRGVDAGGKADDSKAVASDRVTLGGRGEVVPVKFDVTPSERGRRIYRLRVKSPPEDSNAGDDQQEVDVEIVDRKTKVLLVASGPTREYTFLRNQLQRDKETVVDAWLQSAPDEGVSQDAHKLLTEFPTTAQELFEYDAIVAFDPDWRELSTDQVDLLERWVAEKAGGLVVMAGPVQMDRWVQDAKLSKIRGLYPVEFNRRISLMEEGRFGSTTPWPIEFTREGLEAEFLWLSDSAAASQQIWSSFPGVYGYYSVRGAKPGATVYGRYSDPEAGSGNERPVYMAGQFYGAGRVFYLGSGEMWRLRAMSDSYFEQFYTKLVRHVSQGRLLLGSSRGMLLVDRDRYLLGNTVVVRAQLSNVQFEPLDLPSVKLEVIRPDSTSETLQMMPDPARKGMYVGQFTALVEGTYRLEMAVPESDSDQLSRRIQVKVPDLERENPERNDALLSEIARRTGGTYYVGADAVLGVQGMPPLASQLHDRTEVTYLAGIADRDFEHQWLRGLLIAICGLLCFEWLVRRLVKLA